MVISRRRKKYCQLIGLKACKTKSGSQLKCLMVRLAGYIWRTSATDRQTDIQVGATKTGPPVSYLIANIPKNP